MRPLAELMEDAEKAASAQAEAIFIVQRLPGRTSILGINGTRMRQRTYERCRRRYASRLAVDSK